MTSIYLGLRYLFKKRLSYLAIIGVALSVGTLIVVMSVMRGFEHELRSVIRGYLSDIRVESPSQQVTGMADWGATRENVLSMPQVEAATPFIESQSLLRIPGLDQTWTVMFRGMKPELETDVSEFGSQYLQHSSLEALDRIYIDENEAEVPSVFIGNELAKQFSRHYFIYNYLSDELDGELREQCLNLMAEARASRLISDGMEKAGKVAGLLSEAGHMSLASMVYANAEDIAREEIVLMTATEDLRRRVRKFTVAGVFHTGRFDYDSGVVLMSLEAAQDFVGAAGNVSGLNLKLHDYRRDAGTVSAGLREKGYIARTWEDQQRNFLEAVQMERVLMAIVLSFVGLLAGFCIFAILIMSVYEKRHDIGTMKAVGYTSRSIAVIFFVTGGAIGVVGAVFGIAGGFGFLTRINEIADRIEAWTGWTPFPSDVYYFTEIPTDLTLTIPLITGMGALVLSLIFSIVPALKAARMDPVETLRWE